MEKPQFPQYTEHLGTQDCFMSNVKSLIRHTHLVFLYRERERERERQRS